MEFNQHVLHEIFINYVSEIQRQYQTYQRALDNPELIITDMFNPDEYQTLQTVLLNEGIGLHEFGKFLYERLKPFLYELDDEIELDMSYGGIIGIKYMSHTLLRFDIYKHAYVDESYWYSDMLRSALGNKADYYRDTKNTIKKYKKYYSSNRSIWEDAKEESREFDFLYKSYKRTKDLFTLIVRNKTIKSNIARIIKRKESDIRECEDNIQDIKQKIKELEEIQPALDSKLEEWKERFINWGYERKTYL